MVSVVMLNVMMLIVVMLIVMVLIVMVPTDSMQWLLRMSLSPWPVC
jgi:hypothetical protein